jgi:hypothetical protein
MGKFRCGHGLCAGDGGRLGLNWPVPKYLLTELPLLSTPLGAR